jgi:4-amino-4-deoxy-L-arabinose transferase-like glycosyltransferase
MSASPGLASIAHDYPGIAGRGLIYDEFQYLALAKCLSSGPGYAMSPGEPSAVRVPGYPIYLAALFRIFGSSVRVALLGNALLVALLPALTFALAKPAFGRKAAVVAAFFCAFDPGLYFFGLSVAYSEALFAVLLCAGTLMWQRAQSPDPEKVLESDLSVAKSGTGRSADLPETRRPLFFSLAAGILFGAVSLTRAGMLGLPFLIVAIEFMVRRQNLFFKRAAVFVVAFAFTLLPWPLRNHAVMGAWIVSSTNDGVTLLGSVLAAKQHRGDWLNPAEVAPEYARVQRMPDGIERDRAETRLAIGELKKISPVTLLEVAVKRVLRLWVPLIRIVTDDVGPKANLAVNLFYFPAMLLAAFGLWKARHNPAIIPLWTVCLYLTLLAALSWGGTRFRYGVEPFLAIFAAYGLLEVKRLSSAWVRRQA